MKKIFLIVLFCISFNSYSDELIFECPETLYINSISLGNEQPLPFNIELDVSSQSPIHLIGFDLYHNELPIKSNKIEGNEFLWTNLNRFPQGLDDWVYFVCDYQNNIKLTKKVIYVSECKAHSISSISKKYLSKAEFECE